MSKKKCRLLYNYPTIIIIIIIIRFLSYNKRKKKNFFFNGIVSGMVCVCACDIYIETISGSTISALESLIFDFLIIIII